MPGSKFKFNPQTLRYERVELTFGKILGRIFIFLSSVGIVFIILYFSVFQFFLDTPQEKMLKRENSQLLLQIKSANLSLDKIKKNLNELKERDQNIYKALLGSEPISDEMWEAGIGGTDKYEKLLNFKDADILIETNKKLDKLQKQINIQKKSYNDVINLALDKEKKLKSIPAIMPIYNKNFDRLATGWGMRIHPIYKIPKFHYGIDFTAPEGTEIYATGDGVIAEVRISQTYGKVVTINHGYGIKTLYAHMSKFNVKVGQKVLRGTVIGYVGNTGQSAGDHVHYEVMVNGNKVNPINYFFNDISPEEYDKMIKISSNAKKSLD